jgi:hypothetical protein
VHLILLDAFEPIVAITDPFEGALYAMDSLTAIGFVSEIGSGLKELMYHNGSGWTDLMANEAGDWNIPLMDLSDGDVTLMVKASDIAGNFMETQVTVRIDTMPPNLIITTPTDLQIFNVSTVQMTGTGEADAELYVNGFMVGVVPTDGAIGIDLSLHEGLNIFVIESMDSAGNSVMKSFSVILDTVMPTLVVTGPANGLLTNSGTVTVTGITESDATLTINSAAVVLDEDGSFSHDVTLSEGDNMLEIVASDEAGNVATVVKGVALDTDPPAVSIENPSDGTKVTTDQVLVQISADEEAVLYLNGRMLPTSGDVSRTVLLREGDNDISVRAVDSAGNEATDTITVTLDTRPPRIWVTNPSALEMWTNVGALEMTGGAEGADSVFVNGLAAVLTDTGSWSHSFQLVSGENTINVTATDGVNEVTVTLTVWMMTDAPELIVNAIESVVETPSVIISGTTEQGIDQVEVTIAGVTHHFAVESDGSFSFMLSPGVGTHSVSIKVTNVYGNSKVEQKSFEIEDKNFFPKVDEDEGLDVEPMAIGALIAAIGVTLAFATYISIREMRRRRE